MLLRGHPCLDCRYRILGLHIGQVGVHGGQRDGRKLQFIVIAQVPRVLLGLEFALAGREGAEAIERFYFLPNAIEGDVEPVRLVRLSSQWRTGQGDLGKAFGLGNEHSL